VCASTPSGPRSRGRREGRRRRAHGGGDGRRGQDRKREGPREEEAQESQEGEGPQRCGVAPPTRRGEETPEARPRRTRSPDRGGDHNGPSMIRDARDSGRSTRRPPHHALKPKGDGARGGPGETRTARMARPSGSVTSQSQSQEGMLRREAKAIPVVSSSEGRTPGARPDETNRGDRGGSNASKPAGTAGTQQDPKEATSGVVARHDWVALKGRKTSRERQAPEDGVTASRARL